MKMYHQETGKIFGIIVTIFAVLRETNENS